MLLEPCKQTLCVHSTCIYIHSKLFLSFRHAASKEIESSAYSLGIRVTYDCKIYSGTNTTNNNPRRRRQRHYYVPCYLCSFSSIWIIAMRSVAIFNLMRTKRYYFNIHFVYFLALSLSPLFIVRFFFPPSPIFSPPFFRPGKSALGDLKRPPDVSNICSSNWILDWLMALNKCHP